MFIEPTAPIRAVTPIPSPMSEPSQLECCLGITSAVIKRNANSRKNFAAKFVNSVLFSEDERRRCNCHGKRGKKTT